MRAIANTEAMKTGYTLEVFGEGGVSQLESPMDNWAYTDVPKQECPGDPGGGSLCFWLSWKYYIHMSSKASLLRLEDLEIHLFPGLTADMLWEVLVTGLRGWLCVSTVKGLTLLVLVRLSRPGSY